MYPQVYKDLVKFIDEFGNARVLPTPAFFYGLMPGEEISVEIEEGKILIIKLIYAGEHNADGEPHSLLSLTAAPASSLSWTNQSRRRPNAGPKPTLPTRCKLAPPSLRWSAPSQQPSATK